MIDFEKITIPDDATNTELREICLLLLDSVEELSKNYADLSQSIRDMIGEKPVTLNRSVYAAEIPEGQRWTKISDKLWHYKDDNGSVYVKNQAEYEHAMANETDTIQDETETTGDESENPSKDGSETEEVAE